METNKKTWIIAICVIAVLVVMAVLTCPDKQAHEDAMVEEITMAYKHQVTNQAGMDEDTQALSYAFGAAFIPTLVEGYLQYDNYFVFSLGKVGDENGTRPASIGVFGHVFMLIDHEDLEKKLEEEE